MTSSAWWFSTFLMMQPFNTVPYSVVTPNHKIDLLLLRNCNFSTVMNHNVNRWCYNNFLQNDLCSCALSCDSLMGYFWFCYISSSEKKDCFWSSTPQEGEILTKFQLHCFLLCVISFSLFFLCSLTIPLHFHMEFSVFACAMEVMLPDSEWLSNCGLVL